MKATITISNISDNETAFIHQAVDAAIKNNTRCVIIMVPEEKEHPTHVTKRSWRDRIREGDSHV